MPTRISVLKDLQEHESSAEGMSLLKLYRLQKSDRASSARASCFALPRILPAWKQVLSFCLEQKNCHLLVYICALCRPWHRTIPYILYIKAR